MEHAGKDREGLIKKFKPEIHPEELVWLMVLLHM
jgi:hypothetical protein